MNFYAPSGENNIKQQDYSASKSESKLLEWKKIESFEEAYQHLGISSHAKSTRLREISKEYLNYQQSKLESME